MAIWYWDGTVEANNLSGSGSGGGGSTVATQRTAAISTLTSGSGVTIEVDFPTPFEDDLYTVEATVEVSESISTAPVIIGGIRKNSPGVGVFAYIYNFDSVSHNVTVHVMAVHD